MVKNKVIDKGDYYAIIPNGLYKNKRILIDKDDMPLFKDKTLYVNKHGYALFKHEKQELRVHNVVMGIIRFDKKHVVDHINGNRLDNRKSNLRYVSIRENNRNKSKYSRNNTGVIGIQEYKVGNKHYYAVTITDPNSKLTEYGQGTRHQKTFSIHKYGKDKAFKLAKNYLNRKKKELKYKL